MSRFFIHRPVFAGVIAIVIVLAGLVAAKLLAVAQYPEIAPPTVLITTTYTGASAETLAKTVAAPIEEQLSGVENLVYFSSSSASNGTLTITCTFAVGSDGDKATIDVNNRVQIAQPRLPDDVRRSGVIGQKPAPADQAIIYTVTARGRLLEPEDFGNIVLRSNGPNGVLRIRDVARVELGAINYDASTALDGRPTIGIAVYLQSGANALE